MAYESLNIFGVNFPPALIQRTWSFYEAIQWSFSTPLCVLFHLLGISDSQSHFPVSLFRPVFPHFISALPKLEILRGKKGFPWSNEFEKYSVKQNSIAYFTTGPSRAFSILMCIVTLQKANKDCSVSSSNWSWNPFQRTSNNTDRTQFINLQIKTSGSSVNFSLVEDMLYAASLLDFNSEVSFSCFLEILPDLLYILISFTFCLFLRSWDGHSGYHPTVQVHPWKTFAK